jgi:GxxExxY protein
MSQIQLPDADDKRDLQTYAIIGAAMEVHRILGSRFLETVYQCALAVELRRCGVPLIRELAMPVYYKSEVLEVGFRADFICFDEVLVELKAMDRLTDREQSQVINYLAVARLGRGLVLNFGSRSLEYKRIAGSPSAESVKSVGPRFRSTISATETAGSDGDRILR